MEKYQYAIEVLQKASYKEAGKLLGVMALEVQSPSEIEKLAKELLMANLLNQTKDIKIEKLFDLVLAINFLKGTK